MARLGQRLGAAYFVALTVAAVAVAVFVPAPNIGDRFLHALFLVCAVGVIAIIGLFVAMLVGGVRQFAKSRHRD
ncbi:MAG: hypothetical protein M3N95_09200 [Actinomycetota bacterium]|nr:hypothetical protein [Actinomycetota bacterium]